MCISSCHELYHVELFVWRGGEEGSVRVPKHYNHCHGRHRTDRCKILCVFHNLEIKFEFRSNISEYRSARQVGIAWKTPPQLFFVPCPVGAKRRSDSTAHQLYTSVLDALQVCTSQSEKGLVWTIDEPTRKSCKQDRTLHL
jgi:hypothetical protein